MDSKDGKKKESIDEILSDLNGLLNKMPSILDGIRMPEIKPVEFTAAEPAPKPVAEVSAPEPEKEIPLPVFNADKTVVLDGFSGLQEGSAAPAEKPVAAEPFEIESFAKPAEAAKQPETGGLVPQSLGDFMFGEDAEQKTEPVAAPEPPALFSSSLPEEITPEAGLLPADTVTLGTPDLSLQQPDALAEEPAQVQPVADPKPANIYENTRDFGVPDIDALMQLSQDEILGKTAPEPAPEQAMEPVIVPAPQPEALKEEPSMDELAEFERQLKAAGEQGGEMANKPEEEKEKPAEEIIPEAAASAEPAQESGTGFEGLTIEPEAASEPEAQSEVANQSEIPAEMNFNPVTPEAQPEAANQSEILAEINSNTQAPEPQSEPALQIEPSSGINLGSVDQVENTQQEQQSEPAVEAEAPGELELSVGRPAEEIPQAESGQGLVLEPSNAFMTAQPEDAGGETLVVPPPAAADDGDKTMIYDAGSAPGSTNRAPAGDFNALSAKQTPEGIPADRVRPVMFLYATEEKSFCAAVLAELDAICLKSATKPMFIRRAGVKECSSDMNANYILQMASDSGAIGLVCVGAIPQEKIYEVENVFTSSGSFFRHYDAANFSHSVALDLVSDLILRI